MPPSISVAMAPAINSSRSSVPTSPRQSTTPSSIAGRTTHSNSSRSDAWRTLAAITSRRPVRRATSIASTTPFSCVTRPTSSRSSPAVCPIGVFEKSRPWWIVAIQLAPSFQRRWLSLIETSGTSGSASSSADTPSLSRRPWSVETTGVGTSRAIRIPAASRCEWMMSKRSASAAAFAIVRPKYATTSPGSSERQRASGIVGTSR